MIGSSNAEWVPCCFDGGSSYGAFYIIEDIRNSGGTDYYLKFTLPLPTNRGGKKLYVKGVKVLINDADGNDYLNMIKVIGIKAQGVSLFFDDFTNRTSPGEVVESFTAKNCSYDGFVCVTLHIVGSSQTQIDIGGTLLDCYYG